MMCKSLFHSGNIKFPLLEAKQNVVNYFKAAFTRQTEVGKLKLRCVKDTRTVGKLLATNRTCLYSLQLFRQLFCVGKLESDV